MSGLNTTANSKQRACLPATQEALTLLGMLIQIARKERKMTAADLAERTGISRNTLLRVERGDPTVSIGVVFEAAMLVGIPLFDTGPGRFAGPLALAEAKLAVLPKSIRQSKARDIDDDF
ncbi:helix-turn-helix transcriptional regulator [Leeia oryzae]|uniref:helix-turn-helix transcriptional regulator n=1 Tax=Leeia oryzae TaxID=356662 RepID=UPI0004757794|nr:helix-turn-helix transcriptional regulator [Leeia oryzae]